MTHVRNAPNNSIQWTRNYLGCRPTSRSRGSVLVASLRSVTAAAAEFGRSAA